MKFFFGVTLLVICFNTSAQTNRIATLQLIYPQKSLYDTLLVRNLKGKIYLKASTFKDTSKRIETYLLNIDSTKHGYFSIYFGGSLPAITDTLYFQSYGENLRIEIEDSFSLRNHINFKFKGVYNFENLYEKYIQYCSSRLKKYSSSSDEIARKKYFLKTQLEFVSVSNF